MENENKFPEIVETTITVADKQKCLEDLKNKYDAKSDLRQIFQENNKCPLAQCISRTFHIPNNAIIAGTTSIFFKNMMYRLNKEFSLTEFTELMNNDTEFPIILTEVKSRDKHLILEELGMTR